MEEIGDVRQVAGEFPHLIYIPAKDFVFLFLDAVIMLLLALLFLLGLAAALGFRPSEESLAPYVGEDYRLVGQFLTSSTAEAMLKPALEEFSAGRFRDTAYFEPFYLKDFVATVGKKLF